MGVRYMNRTTAVKNVIKQFAENQLIYASKLYREHLSEMLEETTFFKIIERMCKSGELIKLSKGIYHLPKQSKYGIIPISDSDIISAFTENETGMVIGYTMYNSLNLTTQIPKTIDVLSSSLDGILKSIRNVIVHKCSLNYSHTVKIMIQGLEIFQNLHIIQDINYGAFIKFAKVFADNYSDDIFELVYAAQRYKKATISFARDVLSYYDKIKHIY